MEILQKWLDHAPTLRSCEVSWTHRLGWYVVLHDGEKMADGIDATLDIAVVAAILALRKNKEG